MRDPDTVFLALGVLSFVLAVISGLRLAQRLAARNYLSAAGFAVRLVLSCYFVWFFVSVAWTV